MVYIETEILKKLYWEENLSSSEIGKRFGINGRTVRKKLKKQGIPCKTVSQALTKKFKKDFSENLQEKAYLLGLRTGDFHGKWAKKSIRIQTTTTHPAQVELTKNAFEKYGETRVYLSKSKKRQTEWFVYVDLNSTFVFLLEKPEKIELEIIQDENYFYQFLAAYSDCEGNWNIVKNHKDSVKITFRIRTGDKEILEQIKQKLQEENYPVFMYLDKKTGETSSYGAYTKDIYCLAISRKGEIIRLAKKLLPLSRHYEKIKKMELILNGRNKRWHEIKGDLKKLQNSIREERLRE